MNLTEVDLYGTTEAEILYFALSVCCESGFGIPKDWNGLFNDFRKLPDFEIEENVL